MRIPFFQGCRETGTGIFLSAAADGRIPREKRAKAGTKTIFPLAKRALTRYIM